MKRRVCVVTGSRAEYGLLVWLMKAIAVHPQLDLQVVATGMHLAPEFGSTYRQIEDDGFQIDAKVEMLLSSDTPVGISKSIGLGVIGFADAFERLHPEIVVVLGDRFEVLAAAQAALMAGIPLAHLHGGEATEGAVDEAIRHAVTKMAHIHFTAAAEYRDRVLQMGEDPRRVFNFGPMVTDSLLNLVLLEREALEVAMGFRLGVRNLLITFHPATLDKIPSEAQFGELLAALEELPEAHCVFTKPNADTDGRVIGEMIDRYVENHPRKAIAFTSMGQLRYLSMMRLADAVVGNSSSGIIEAPLLGVPTLNIGDRQRGRARAPSIIDCSPIRSEICSGLARIYSEEFRRETRRFVQQPSAAVGPRIANVLANTSLEGMLMKHFHSLRSENLIHGK